MKITNTGCEPAPLPPNAAAQIVRRTNRKKRCPKAGSKTPSSRSATLLALPRRQTLKRPTRSPSRTNRCRRRHPTIYLGQRPNAEVSAERAAKEAEYKAKEAVQRKERLRQSRSESEKGQIRSRKRRLQHRTTANTKPKKRLHNDKGKYEDRKNELHDRQKQIRHRKNERTPRYKGKYETEKTQSTTTEKTKYTTKKRILKQKAEYEKTRPKAEKSQPENRIRKIRKEYKTETATKRRNYKNYEAKYKTAETEYKTTKPNTKRPKPRTKTTKANTKPPKPTTKRTKANIKPPKPKYKEYESAYKTRRTAGDEYQYYLEYVAAKAAYNKAKAEEEEAAKAGVTVEAGTNAELLAPHPPAPTPLRAAERQRGFTLIEMLVAMVTGVIVTGALFTILDFSSSSPRVSRASPRRPRSGRAAMTRIVDELHSSCLSGRFTPVMRKQHTLEAGLRQRLRRKSRNRRKEPNRRPNCPPRASTRT